MESRGKATRAFLALAVSSVACSEPAPVRPQLVVFIDTDAPVVGQLASSGSFSADATVDTVRIDILGDQRQVVEVRDLIAPDPLDWPLSFGIASVEGTRRRITLRIRAFRASRAARGSLAGSTTLEPPGQAVIDRIVELEPPERGVKEVTVVLATTCLGAPASFELPLHTCVDDARRSTAPSEGLGGPTSATRVGTAAAAREVPCVGASPEGAHCVPGGLTLLGDAQLSHAFQGVASNPTRPVVLSPFHMDELEFTVGRYRALLAKRAVTEQPIARSAGALEQYATWLGATDASNDAYPLNEISFEGARQACVAVGGHLPTEAQWEHAARGRGRGYAFPWGNEQPRCCTASASRPGGFAGEISECAPANGITGVEPAGLHTRRPCDGPSDVSPDGIRDLAGSLSEVTLDGGVSYADACWAGPGLVRDPSCIKADLRPGTALRGGSWNGTLYLLASALRPFGSMPAPTAGFRCVYDDVP